MRVESLIIGIVILGLGIYLVSTNGNIAGVNLPKLIGLPTCNTGANSTCSGSSEFGNFGVGTVVAIFGLGMIGNGLRSPSTTRSPFRRDLWGGPPAPVTGVPQQSTAVPAFPATPAEAPGRQAGVRYCSACGGANLAVAKFCQHCAEPMPPQMPPKDAAPAPPPPPPPAGPTGSG